MTGIEIVATPACFLWVGCKIDYVNNVITGPSQTELAENGAMAFGTTIYFLATRQLGPQKASSFIFTVPVTAMLFAMLFLNEELTITIAIGSILAMFAVYLINKKS